VLALLVLGLAPAARAQAASTVVSLTFDDGTASEYQARAMLSAHGMHGTFYLNSARIGSSSYYMTWPQIQDLASDGNEIGGHTAHHVDLVASDPAEAQREICQDRVNLLGQGFAPRNFAYPFGSHNAAIETMVQNCGYNSARTTSPGVAETIPPRDPYAIIESSGSSSLTDLKNAVTAAEQSGGGWVTIVFHQLCNACDTNWVLPSDFNAFLDWLQPRAANGTAVKTVNEVIGGPLQPAVQPLPPPPAANGWNGVRNESLEIDGDGDSVPDCFGFDTWGQNTYKFTRTSDAHSGSWAERVDVSNYHNGDAKLVQTEDLGSCTPTVTPGHRYEITAWYKSTDPVTFTAFSRSSSGSFDFWNSSTSFPAASSWTKATWVTPTIPAGVTGLAFGLTLAHNGSLTVDDLGINDAAPTGSDTTAPTASLTAPAAGSTVSGTVSITADASDNIGVDHVEFLVDGSVVGAKTTAIYSLHWDSRTVANGTHTVAVRAVDLAGNVTTTAPVSVTVSNNFTNLLQNPSLELGTGTPSCWLLGGFGTNTFAWTRTSDAHTGLAAEKLDITAYTDGDRKMVSTQDTGACAPAVTPGHNYTASVYYKSSATARLFAYYRSSAGVWTFWSSASFPATSTWSKATWTSPAMPAGATNISVGMGLSAVGSVTMDDFELFDNAPPPDTTPPTSSITCNTGADGAGCMQGYYNAPVDVSLTASDTGGSGLKEIRYTTDGSTPTATTGSVYGGPFSVASTTTVKYRAFDNAGNAEAVNSQLIQIDTAPPTSSVACDGAACASGYYITAVSVALTATDETGGSGLKDVRYTTDGSTPTATTGTVYSGPFSVASTTTVKYRAFDNAGNAEAVNSQLIQVDTTAPASTVKCNATACAITYYGAAVSVTLSATDTGGAGLKEIRYTTDGTTPTATTGTVYSSAFSVGSTTTVKYRAFDNAGNAEAVNSQQIQIDTTAPTVAITAPTNNSTVTASVKITANAADAASGIAKVTFYVDNTALATVTAAPWTTNWNTKKSTKGVHSLTAVAEDKAGNKTTSAAVTVTVK
jgi:peptidoglycan/xylan/chitin deacetylase (PgdA/CDA1 family)